jgi:hypothetical protein
MLSLLMRTLALLTLALALGGCSPASSTPPDSGADATPVHVETDITNGEPAEPREPISPQFTDTLLGAAAKYAKWGRVDERPNLAPVLCRAPMGLDYGFPSHARLSTADDAPHGLKLYYLFAGLGEHGYGELYGALGTPAAQAIPIGFAIVKQSWTAVPSSRPIANEPVPVGEVLDMHLDAPTPISWVEHDGQRLEVGEQAELFVMAKVGEHDMPGTDAGWIYGTLTADGKTVTSAGLVQRCMDCHEAATHERLFGLQTTKAFASVKPSPWAADKNEPLPPSLGLMP